VRANTLRGERQTWQCLVKGRAYIGCRSGFIRDECGAAVRGSYADVTEPVGAAPRGEVLAQRREEGAPGADAAVRIGLVAYLETQGLRAGSVVRGRQRNAYRQIANLAWRQVQRARAVQFEGVGVDQVNDIAARLLGLVDDLQAVDVLDLAQRVLAEQATVAGHVQGNQRTFGQRPDEGTDHHRQHGRVADQTRAQPVGLATGQLVLRAVAHQAAGIAELVHDAVAGIDAGAAADAFQLQAVADVDAGRADLHADRAVDAVAQTF